MRLADDQTLILQTRAGDPAAFRELVGRYHKRVYGIALGMLHNDDDAMDVTQEAFIRVHRYLDNFKGTASFYTWLYRITVNLCIDQMRKGGKTQTVDYDDQIGHEEGDVPELRPGTLHGHPEQNLHRTELQGLIRRALDTLSAKHRAVIIMREVEGLSYKEMAQVMSCSVGTIMSRLFHARRRMQAALTELLDEAVPEGAAAYGAKTAEEA